MLKTNLGKSFMPGLSEIAVEVRSGVEPLYLVLQTNT